MPGERRTRIPSQHTVQAHSSFHRHWRGGSSQKIAEKKIYWELSEIWELLQFRSSLNHQNQASVRELPSDSLLFLYLLPAHLGTQHWPHHHRQLSAHTWDSQGQLKNKAEHSGSPCHCTAAGRTLSYTDAQLDPNISLTHVKLAAAKPSTAMVIVQTLLEHMEFWPHQSPRKHLSVPVLDTATPGLRRWEWWGSIIRRRERSLFLQYTQEDNLCESLHCQELQESTY